MSGERYVVLGLAPARTAWFRAVGSWANSGALPAEFVKCLSAEEVAARLESGRPYSALVADGCLPAIDRDLLARAAAAGCAVLVIDDRRVDRDWGALGVARVLPAGFGRTSFTPSPPTPAWCSAARPVPTRSSPARSQAGGAARSSPSRGRAAQAFQRLRWRSPRGSATTSAKPA